ncbi:MAG: pirin family protein [Pseudomonadota bacterium]
MPESVKLLIEPKTRDLGEFSVRRALPDRQCQRVGPFIFFDHMGPATFPPGSGVNVRAHPHIGLATVTFLFDGEILHRDSLGYVQPIRPGAVNWMTAGRGIVHSEKTSEEVLANGQFLHGIQTWIALPTEREEIEPRFEHHPADTIPVVELDGARATVILGSGFGQHSPVKAESETLYLELRMQANAEVLLPVAEELGVYVVDGAVNIAGERVSAGAMAVLDDTADVRVTSDDGAHCMLIGGAALPGERYIEWNFVSSSRERIERAKNDWREMRFDGVPGEVDFIPLPGE